MKPTLELVEGGTTLVCPAMSLRLYLDLTNNSAILNFYERSMEALKGRLKFVIAESANRRTPVNEKALTMAPAWVKKPRPLKGYFIEFYENQTGCGGARLRMAFESRQASDFTPEKLERRRNNWRILESQNPGGGLSLSELLVTFPMDHPLSKPDALLD